MTVLRCATCDNSDEPCWLYTVPSMSFDALSAFLMNSSEPGRGRWQNQEVAWHWVTHLMCKAGGGYCSFCTTVHTCVRLQEYLIVPSILEEGSCAHIEMLTKTFCANCRSIRTLVYCSKCYIFVAVIQVLLLFLFSGWHHVHGGEAECISERCSSLQHQRRGRGSGESTWPGNQQLYLCDVPSNVKSDATAAHFCAQILWHGVLGVFQGRVANLSDCLQVCEGE